MSDIRWDILRPVDVGERFQQGFQLAQRNALLQQEQAYQQQERARTGQLRNALTSAVTPDGNVDYAAARRAYIGAGDIPGALAIDTARSQTQQRLTEAQEQQLVIGAQLLDGVTDEAGFQAARQTYARMGLDLAGIPERFDQTYVQGVIRAGRALQGRSGQQQPTSFQRDDAYIRETYGDDAGDQFVQRRIAPPPLTTRNADGTITIIPQASPVQIRRRGDRPQQPVTRTPEQLREDAAEAIRNGADPAAVNARLQQMLGGGEQPADTRPANDPAPAFHPAPAGVTFRGVEFGHPLRPGGR